MDSIRSLVRVGNSLYISLPKNWTKSLGLDKGSKVELIVREDNVLEVIPIYKKVLLPKKISIVYDKMFRHKMMAAYLAGYEVVEVEVPSGASHRVIEEIEDMLRLLVGVEVVEESERKIVLQCFTRDDYDIVQVLGMMDRITRSMYTNAIKCLFNRDVKGLEFIIERDNRVDRLYFLSVRLIRSLIRNPMIPSERKVILMDLRLLARDLEEIGDLSEEMAREILFTIRRGVRITPSEEIQDISQEISDLQSSIMTTLLRSTRPRTDIFERIKGLKYRIRLQMKRLSSLHTPNVLSDIMHLLEDIVNRVEDISDLII
ncbi:MAG: hypothetical protein DRN53_06855 [Thermoprotei archaeon]|nr:MAG: hypothetical protein DRN53_06855 [Thermoprotei archaeon]